MPEVETSANCKRFTDFLIRHQPHFDDDIINTLLPTTSGWIGHVPTGAWPAGTEVEHTFDRTTRMFPDLSGCWEDVEGGSCLGTPCDPNEKFIGWGTNRLTYRLQSRSYRTQLLCFDQIQTAAKAKEQFAEIISGLRQSTVFIVTDRHQRDAVTLADNRVVADDSGTATTWTPSADCMTITVDAMPTSLLRVNDLQRWVRPLRMAGYLGINPEGSPGMYELVTDDETAWRLREGNPDLAPYVRLDNFIKGGALFKFGISDVVGNFMVRFEALPLRFQIVNDTTLRRVMPYTKEAATSGINMAVNQDYINARVQVSFIYHRMGFRSLVRESSQINPAMPFGARKWNGQWQFGMDNLGADASGCVINNVRRNKGYFFNDFQFATRPEHTEFLVAILHLVEQPCLVVQEPCSDDPGYSEQDYTSDNDTCETQDISFTPTPDGGPFSIAANTITCNGVPIVHDAVSGATVAALATDLQSKVSILGTWTADGDEVVLSGTPCNSVGIEFE